ncbi:MAG: winged helix-turn-helix domain-containing protein [Anaerolineae bacterium]|nr:winged helix-turn-helix domain-containing protein [Anaerolineae bacterium]
MGATTATADGQFWTVADLQGAVEEWYGVTYRSPSSYLYLFAVCGFSYQRPAKVFQSRREAEVMDFQEALEKN